MYTSTEFQMTVLKLKWTVFLTEYKVSTVVI